MLTFSEEPLIVESNNKTFLDSHSQDTRWIYSTGELSPCDKNTDDTEYKV